MNLLTFATIGTICGSVAAVTAAPHKVTICHANGKQDHPYVRIVVNENAIHGHFLNKGTPKAGHEDDLLLDGVKKCPEKTDTSTPEPEPSPAPSPTPTTTTTTPTPLPTPSTVTTPVTETQADSWGK